MRSTALFAAAAGAIALSSSALANGSVKDVFLQLTPLERAVSLYTVCSDNKDRVCAAEFAQFEAVNARSQICASLPEGSRVLAGSCNWAGQPKGRELRHCGPSATAAAMALTTCLETAVVGSDSLALLLLSPKCSAAAIASYESDARDERAAEQPGGLAWSGYYYYPSTGDETFDGE